jgi:hypothetical protein
MSELPKSPDLTVDNQVKKDYLAIVNPELDQIQTAALAEEPPNTSLAKVIDAIRSQPLLTQALEIYSRNSLRPRNANAGITPKEIVDEWVDVFQSLTRDCGAPSSFADFAEAIAKSPIIMAAANNYVKALMADPAIQAQSDALEAWKDVVYTDSRVK